MTDSSPSPSPPPAYEELSTPGALIIDVSSSTDPEDSGLRNNSDLSPDLVGSILGDLFNEGERARDDTVLAGTLAALAPSEIPMVKLKKEEAESTELKTPATLGLPSSSGAERWPRRGKCGHGKTSPTSGARPMARNCPARNTKRKVEDEEVSSVDGVLI